jgi:hypothetical protein
MRAGACGPTGRDPGAAGYARDDPPGAVPVQAVPVHGEEDQSFAALADGQVDGPWCAARVGW